MPVDTVNIIGLTLIPILIIFVLAIVGSAVRVVRQSAGWSNS